MRRCPISIGRYTLAYLAKRFPCEPPSSVKKAFVEALEAYGIRRGYVLRYVSKQAIQYACDKASVTAKIGELGCAVGRIAYVCYSHSEGRIGERVTAIHEAAHFAFGGHPWPHETGGTPGNPLW